ncbi:hypothetical protein L286_14080 [Sphingobium sp. HDIP04]|nr:hypothetical protein L286_14080 [Sphingobium sp. HDIP04]
MPGRPPRGLAHSAYRIFGAARRGSWNPDSEYFLSASCDFQNFAKLIYSPNAVDRTGITARTANGIAHAKDARMKGRAECLEPQNAPVVRISAPC